MTAETRTLRRGANRTRCRHFPTIRKTPYVIEGELDTLRDPVTNLLPRFFNTRLVMENNVDSDNAAVPFLRGFGISYRMN